MTSDEHIPGNGHLPAVFFDWLDHLARCRRCQTRAMTTEMLADLVAAYRQD
jgi:hypothetical protein